VIRFKYTFLILIILSTSSYSNDSFEDFEDEIQVEKRIDPLSGYNRAMTSFNDVTYEYVFRPVAKTYGDVVHDEIRGSVRNFFHNLFFPIRLVNNLLQLKFENSAEETGRFLINSTVGLFGLFDVAQSEFNLVAHDEDFGQTLGYWGVGSGFHIVWPFLGPSNLRDSFGSFGVDAYLNPTLHYENRPHNLLDNSKDALGVNIFKQINNTSLRYKNYDTMKKDAIDLYPFLRDSYEQYRDKQIEE
jgi:phospholipid-binding lipoprotein MlaA